MEYNPADLPDIDVVEVLDLKNGPSKFRPSMDPATPIRTVRVTGEVALEVERLWRLLPYAEQMRCHTPAFGFRFYVGEDVLYEASVCWKCNNIHMRKDGEWLYGYHFDGEAAVSQELLALARQIMGEELEVLPTVDDWIESLLGQSIEEINEAYSWKKESKVETRAGRSLGTPHEYRARAGGVKAELVEALHRKIRGQKCEAKVWSGLLFYLGPLPPAVAHDLIDRDKMVNTLGHARQSDEVQWRLAGLVDEALLTLFWDMYTQPRYQVEELEKLLSLYPAHSWLLEKWDHWPQLASSREKEIAFHRWAWQHPQRRPTLPSPEEYLEVMAERERRAFEEKERLEREAEEERLRVEREFERIRGTVWDEEEIERMLNEKDPLALLAMAGNRVVERKWVERLVNCYGVKGARAIREAAVRNLEGRL